MEIKLELTDPKVTIQRIQRDTHFPVDGPVIPGKRSATDTSDRRNPLRCPGKRVLVLVYELTGLLAVQVKIRRPGFQPGIVQVLAHGEVVQALPFAILEPENFVHFVVEKTTDAGSAKIARLCFEI